MNVDEIDALIDRYESGYDAVVAALDGITNDELDLRGNGVASREWTARQIVHHLADSEANSYLRLRKLLAEEDTLIQGYDENLWASQPWYGGPVEPSMVVLKAVRESSAALLRTLTEADFAKVGTHTESGPGYTMDFWLQAYADHPHDHADQIRRARAGYRTEA
jgi:DinB superfamily